MCIPRLFTVWQRTEVRFFYLQNPTVRCGAGFSVENRTVRYGADLYFNIPTVRCGTGVSIWESYCAVRCRLYFKEFYCAVRCNFVKDNIV